MKLNNELLVIDLETTASKDENGYQTNNDIIQIGAVLLNRDLCPILKFDELVKPRESISQEITNLTGITNEMVADAQTFPEVFKELERKVSNEVNNIKTVRFCAWGTYFDIPIIRRLYREHKLDFPWSGTAFDIKTLAMFYMSMSDRRTDKLSVEHVMKILKLEPDGKYHNAFTDAKAEADILIQIMQDLEQGTFVDGDLIRLDRIR